MNRPPNPKQKDSAPIADPIDFLLDEELAGSVEELAPSSGFVLSVMESIHAQAAEPPPIAFPWSRVVPGAIAALCCLAALIVFGLRTLHAGTTATRAPQVGALLAHSLSTAFTVEEVTLCGVLMAACLSVAAVAASFRLTGRKQ